MSDHGWSVALIVEPTLPGSFEGIRHYRATCTCGQWFNLHDREIDAQLDGIDHVRTVEGRKTRREEIVEETAVKAEAAARKKAATPQRGRR